MRFFFAAKPLLFYVMFGKSWSVWGAETRKRASVWRLKQQQGERRVLNCRVQQSSFKQDGSSRRAEQRREERRGEERRAGGGGGLHTRTAENEEEEEEEEEEGGGEGGGDV